MKIGSSDLVNRRVFLKAVGGAGAAALAHNVLPGDVSLQASTIPGSVIRQNYRIVQTVKDPLKLITIWLGGGASHIDSFNLPPESATVSTGPFRPTRTSIPGVLVTDQLIRTARILNKTTLFRNITHNQGDHGPATALFFTGSDRLINDRGDSRFNTPLNANALAQAAIFANSRYFALNANQERPPYSGVEGRDPNSFSIGCNFAGDNAYPSPLNGGVGRELLNQRIGLLNQIQQGQQLDSNDPRVAQFVQSQQVAIDTVNSNIGSAFDLNKMDPRLRDRVGRNPLGNAVLTAANLINSGAKFVTINDGFWDSHYDLEQDLRVLLPRLDYAFSGLVEMIEMGVVDEDTMVVIATEFGRHPTLAVLYDEDDEPYGGAGREHWPHSSFALVYGPENVVGQGNAVGRINIHGRFPDNVTPYSAPRFWEAILNGCGYARENLDRLGNPTGRRFPTYEIFNRSAQD